MSKTAKIILHFSLATACLISAIAFGVGAVKSFIENFEAIATVDSPGQTTFPVRDTERVTLWHEYTYYDGGTFVSHLPALPSGYSFTLTNNRSGQTIPLDAARATTNSNIGSTQRTSVGSFAIPADGDYTLLAEGSGPEDGTRRFAVTNQSFGDQMRAFFLGFAGVGALLLAMLVFLVLGVIACFSKPKAAPPQLPSGT